MEGELTPCGGTCPLFPHAQLMELDGQIIKEQRLTASAHDPLQVLVNTLYDQQSTNT